MATFGLLFYLFGTHPIDSSLACSFCVAFQVFLFFGVKERLQDLLEDARYSKLLHLPDRSTPPKDRPDKTVRSIWDSAGWYDHVVKQPGADGQPFGSNDRNIVLGLNVDGFAPFNMAHNSFSMTQFACQILNLPENLRHRHRFIILAGLHPGPRKPRNQHPLLQLLVKELTELAQPGGGIVFTCPYTNTLLRAQVKLLVTSCDYPAHAENNCQQDHKAYMGCIKCWIRVS